MAQVVLDDVMKDFPGGVRALDRFSLDVTDGEFVVVVGPSGSGKSTLLRLVAGLERVSAGTIRIGNRAVSDLAPRHRNVAMAFQNPALYPHLSVFDNLAFPLRLRKMPRATIVERVRDVAKQLAISALLDRKPPAISGGERQRVALGRVLVRETDCNLYDEPLAQLDRPLVEQLQTRLIELHRQRPTTTLFVTHDQQEALALGSRIVVLCGGKIQQVAPPLEIYDRPANRFVAGFFGSPAMNFLEGQLVSENGQLLFVCGTVRLRLDAEEARRLAHRAGANVVAGIRPEAISEVDPASAAIGDDQFAATVRLSELLGDRVFHRIETSTHQKLVSRGTTHCRLPLNVTRPFQVHVEQLRFFDPDSLGAAWI